MKCIKCGGELEEKKNAKIVVGYYCLVCKKYHPNYQDAVDCETSHKSCGKKYYDTRICRDVTCGGEQGLLCPECREDKVQITDEHGVVYSEVSYEVYLKSKGKHRIIKHLDAQYFVAEDKQ